MDFPYALCRHLGALTDARDDPRTDLQAVLAVLADDLTAVVPSFLGLSMTLHLDGDPITLTAVGGAWPPPRAGPCNSHWTRWPAPAAPWCATPASRAPSSTRPPIPATPTAPPGSSSSTAT